MDMIEELAALKAQVGALAARVAAIENLGGRKIIPAPVEPVVMVTHPAAPATTDLPDGKELQALRVICAREYPKWVDSDGFVFGRRGTVSKQENDREWLLQFGRSILAISNMRVLDKPDKTRPSSAMSTPQLTCFNIGKSARELRMGPFCMACFVMGVPVSGLGLASCAISFGLSEYTGKPIAPGAWRSILRACSSQLNFR
jgi:hypothetical protein